jgi:hypothetical protein
VFAPEELIKAAPFVFSTWNYDAVIWKGTIYNYGFLAKGGKTGTKENNQYQFGRESLPVVSLFHVFCVE